MNKYFLTIHVFLILTFSTVCFSQSPTPTPTPEESKDTDVVKISTNLIQVDVTVTDKKGNQVTDLKPEDFEILENGKKQEITNFSYIALAPENSDSEAAVKKPTSKASIPTPPVNLKPEQVRRTYALVVDDLGLSFASNFWVKQSLRKFVNEQMQDGDLVAILRTGGGIGALQSFTFDRRQLLVAIDKIRWNARGGKISNFEPLRSNGVGKSGENTLGSDVTNDALQVSEQFRQNSIKAGTLGALRFIVNGMKDLPGRKSIILLSEGFNIYEPDKKGGATNPLIFQPLRVLTELANRESIIFYPIDPRGLVAPGLTAIDDTSDFRLGNFDVENDPIRRVQRNRETELRITQDSLRYLAEETGGIPYINQNDLNFGMQKALEDQKGYYLIGYQPDSETFDPNKSKFNKLTVKLRRPDLHVRYRSGFFGITDEKIRQTPQTPQQKLSAALTSPFGASEVNLNLYSVFYNDSQDRNFIRAFVYIDPKDLTFTLNSNSRYQAKFDIIAVISDSEGDSAGNDINSHTMQFTKEQLAKAQEKGIIYNLSVPIQKSGAYQFRVALRDSTTGKIGSASQFIEVPNLKEKKLALSNLIVKNYSPAEWKKVSLGQNSDSSSQDSSVLSDTTTRQFKRGTYLTYSFIIYNAVTNAGQKPQLQLQTRLFHNGKMIVEGSPSPISLDGQNDLRRIAVLNAVTLGTELQPGDYALQIVVTDAFAKEKNKVATQWIDFEITGSR